MSVLPKTIAPTAPLPTGNASVNQFTAGLSYQSLVSAACAATAASRAVRSVRVRFMMWKYCSVGAQKRPFTPIVIVTKLIVVRRVRSL